MNRYVKSRLESQAAKRAASRRPSPRSVAKLVRMDGYRKPWDRATLDALFADIDAAEPRLIDGSFTLADDAAISTAIRYGSLIAQGVQRHNHLIPLMQSANDALMAGWRDVEAILDGLAIYRAIIPATGRNVVRNIMARDLAAHGFSTEVKK